MISESQRSPTILSRLKEAYNQPSSVKKIPSSAAQSVQSNDALAKLLNSPEANSLSAEQKQQLKVAFAEGYLAANHPEAQKGGKTMKYLKVSRVHSVYLLLSCDLLLRLRSVINKKFRVYCYF